MAAPARPRAAVGGATARETSSVLVVSRTRDRVALRAFLERDRVFAGYALCALDDRSFDQSRWGIARRGEETVAVAVEQGGPAPQPVFVAGEADAVEELLRSVVSPWSAYITCLPDLLPTVERLYAVEPGPPMVRMAVDRASFRPYRGLVLRLGPSHISELNRMYDLGFTTWLPADSLAKGVYYGLRVNGKLVSAAGTHAVSRGERMGIVGNVLTVRAQRGRGYAKATTSAVTAELLQDLDDVILNVRSDNPPALAAYRALGYREHVRFEERLAHRRAGGWNVIAGALRRLIGW